jgi:nucleotide-binding universal stress UspA family protein
MTPTNSAKYRVVAALDFSQLGDRAVEAALELCEKQPHAEVHVIAVGWDEPGGVRLPGPEGLLLAQPLAEKAVCDHVNKVVAVLEQRGRAVTIESIAVYVVTGEPAERICALASSIDADLIVLGTHGRTGIARWVLGSVAEEVVRRATCGVWVLRPRDFLGGEQVPAIEPPLKAGEHALKPFAHRPTHHYLQRADRKSGHVMPIS